MRLTESHEDHPDRRKRTKRQNYQAPLSSCPVQRKRHVRVRSESNRHGPRDEFVILSSEISDGSERQSPVRDRSPEVSRHEVFALYSLGLVSMTTR